MSWWEPVLGIVYLFVLFYAIDKWSFFKKSGIDTKWIKWVLVAKVLFGFAYIITYQYGLERGDILRFHRDGTWIYSQLWDNPGLYFELTFKYYSQPPEILMQWFEYDLARIDEGLWWNMKSPHYMVVRLIALMSILSFGSIYVNAILFSGLTLIGFIALFRLVKQAYDGKDGLLLLATCLVPSTLFFSSAVHKDGLVIMSIGVALYTAHKLATSFRWIYIPFFLIALAVLGTSRYFMLLLFLPNLLAYLLVLKWPRFSAIKYLALQIIMLVVVFNAGKISPKFDLPQKVVDVQAFFYYEQGGFDIEMTELEPTAKSFISNSPHAFYNIMVKPIPARANPLLIVFANTEGVMILLFILVSFVFALIYRPPIKPILLFNLFMGFSIILLYGLTSDNMVTNFRYKSTALPFLIPALAMLWPNHLLPRFLRDL